MAREMALAGVDKSELTPPPPPQEPKTFSDKCRNFWYHYKVVVIVVAIVAFIGGMLLLQTVTKDRPDYHVIVVTELPMYNEEIDGMQTYLAASGDDLDGDGTVEVEVENLTPQFYEEIAPNVGHADMQKLMSYLSTGERMLFAFDKVSYDGFMETVSNVTADGYDFLAPFESTDSGYDPTSFYWDWSGDDTRLEYGLGELPEHMLFGVRAPAGMADRSVSRELYEQGKQLLEQLTA